MLKIGALANIRLYCFWKQTYFSCVCGVYVCVHTQVCMHVHVCAYTLIWVHIHLFMCMWSLKLARGVLSSSLRQGISAEARVCSYSWSAGQLPQRSSARGVQEFQAGTTPTCYLSGYWEIWTLVLMLDACVASTLNNVPSPQPEHTFSMNTWPPRLWLILFLTLHLQK